MLMDYNRLGVSPIINAQGNSTPLGSGTLSSGVISAMTEAAKWHVDLDTLWRAAGRILGEAVGTEDACPTAGAFAGVAIAVAAVIAGTDVSSIQRLPNPGDLPNEIVLQKSHSISSGAPIGQMIALGGGCPIEVGTVNVTKRSHLSGAITRRTAGLVYVTSREHVTAYSAASLEEAIAVGREHGIPVIVDAAGERDLRSWPATGADLVIYSGPKALGAPTSGFICGSAQLIAACRAQSLGIARSMKIGKETLMGLLQAVREYDSRAGKEALHARAMSVAERIGAIPGLTTEVIADEADANIFRVLVIVDTESFGWTARRLNQELQDGNPAIYLRDFKMHSSQLEVDPLPLDAVGENEILRRLTELAQKP